MSVRICPYDFDECRIQTSCKNCARANKVCHEVIRDLWRTQAGSQSIDKSNRELSIGKNIKLLICPKP